MVYLGGISTRQSVERDPTQDDTTGMVTAWREGEVAWQALEVTIRGICRSHGQLTLRVELVNGSVERFGWAENTEYHMKPPIGSSLGVGGLSWSTGTLGGYFQISQGDGVPFPCAVTCHHVLRPTKAS